jgi:hypothetical protein
VWHFSFLTPDPTPAEVGAGRRALIIRAELLPSWTKPLGEELQSQCVWHFSSCADFSRSAPLGLQFGAIHLRRDLSSPYNKFSIFYGDCPCNAHSHIMVIYVHRKYDRGYAKFDFHHSPPGNVIISACSPTCLYMVTSEKGTPNMPSWIAQLRPRIDLSIPG